MVIDLNRCIACTGCVAACATFHALPKDVMWNTMVYSEKGSFPNVSRLQMSKACQQCDNTPCVKVCPTGATYKRADGIVMVDYSKCIGCKYCLAACPYDARSFLPAVKPFFDSGFTPFENGSVNAVAGVAQKCTFCADRIDAGIKAGFTPGVDRAASPVCVNTCMAGARYFGDLDNPNSNVSVIITNRRAQQLLPELGTQPKVFYIPPTKSVTVKGMVPS